MSSQLLRIGTRYINVSNIVWVKDEGGNLIVTLTSIENIRTDDDLIRHESEYELFKGVEARALLWWLALNSIDVLNKYAEIVDLVDEIRDQSGALED